MNKDINLSMFFGQSLIRQLSTGEKREINELCMKLSNLIGYKNESKKWNINTYSNLFQTFKTNSEAENNFSSFLSAHSFL